MLLSTSGWPAGKRDTHPADHLHSLCFYLEHHCAGSFTKTAHPVEIPTDQRADAPVPSCPALGGTLCPVGTYHSGAATHPTLSSLSGLPWEGR